jgi:NNP family nitrate/nitrite transporter-like MFS transporter
MKDDGGNPSRLPTLSLRAEATAYLAAFFSIGLQPMANVVVPLWAIHLGIPPLLFGIIMGARSLLPFLFSIHGGVLIDRFGAGRVMMICAVSTGILSLLYPALPWVAPLIALQIFVGMSTTMGWIGAQTQIGKLTRGHPLYMGRFTFSSTIANFFSPMAVGSAWDFGGAWAGFGVIALWSLGLFASSLILPVPDGEAPKARVGISNLLPSLADYRASLALMLIPAVSFAVVASFLMNASYSMRFAFYVVYLEKIGFQGTLIGILVGTASLSGALFALLIGRALRHFEANQLLVAMIITAAVGIGATPSFEGFAGLFVFACIFGLGVGLGMALIYAEMSRSAPIDKLGASIGLRATANRASSLGIPVLMGAIVQLHGLRAGFYGVAALIIIGALGGLLLLRRHQPPARPEMP